MEINPLYAQMNAFFLCRMHRMVCVHPSVSETVSIFSSFSVYPHQREPAKWPVLVLSQGPEQLNGSRGIRILIAAFSQQSIQKIQEIRGEESHIVAGRQASVNTYMYTPHSPFDRELCSLYTHTYTFV